MKSRSSVIKMYEKDHYHHQRSVKLYGLPGLTDNKEMLSIWWHWKGIINFTTRKNRRFKFLLSQQLLSFKLKLRKKMVSTDHQKSYVLFLRQRPTTSLSSLQKLRVRLGTINVCTIQP